MNVHRLQRAVETAQASGGWSVRYETLFKDSQNSLCWAQPGVPITEGSANNRPGAAEKRGQSSSAGSSTGRQVQTRDFGLYCHS